MNASDFEDLASTALRPPTREVHHHVNNVSVVAAPPADAVRLAGEMRDEITRSILASIPVVDALHKTTGVLRIIDDRLHARIQIVLTIGGAGGEPESLTQYVSDRDVARIGTTGAVQEAVGELIRRTGEMLAQRLVTDALSAVGSEAISILQRRR